MNYKLLLSIISLTLFSVGLKAQQKEGLSYGFKAGINSTNQSFFNRNGSEFTKGSYDSRVSPSIGAFAELSSSGPLSAVMVLGYREKGACAAATTGTARSVQQFVYSDLLLKFRKELTSSSIYLLAGNRGELLVASNHTQILENMYDMASEKKLVLSPVVGAGFEIKQDKPRSIFIELEYNPGTTNILQPTALNRNEIRNNSFGAVFGIRL